MRLICPNCSAQYEIDASLIPDEGRDVQCSNCGHNWFELPPAPPGPTPPPDMDIEDATAATSAEPERAPDVDAIPESDGTPQGVDVDDDDEWPQTRKIEAPPPSPQRPRRTAAVEALDVLREEAARELAQRREEEPPPPIETQPDLALGDPRDRATPSRALRARMARLRGEEDEPEEAAEEEEYRAPRRDLLPDIDEINSSLKPANAGRAEMSEAEMVQHRRGFRTGFLGIVGITVLMILTYANAPAIAGAFPGIEAALIGFVDWANGIRDALSRLFGS